MAPEQQRYLKSGNRRGWVRIENPPPSVAHRKLFNLLLSIHLQGDREADFHAVDVDRIRPHVEFSGEVEPQLLLACETLSRTVVRWEWVDDAGNREIGFTPLLSQAWCAAGRLHYSIPPRLRILLRNEKAFGLIHLDVLGLFSGSHSRALYDVLSPLARVETRGWWDVDEFRHLMHLAPEGGYARFSDLRRRVIEPALAEVNALSDLSVAVEYRRHGRQVTGIKFRVSRKNEPPSAECLYLPGADPDRMDPTHALEQEFEAYKAARVCEIIGSMTGAEVDELLTAFVKSIQDNAVLMKKFERDGIDNLSVRLRYEAFLERMLLSREEVDFQRFLGKKG